MAIFERAAGPPAYAAMSLPLTGRSDAEAMADYRRLALGTARADLRPAHGVVDGDLAVHGVTGAYVADRSAVPSSLGVNPQLTIMALATRIAVALLGVDAGSPRARE